MTFRGNAAVLETYLHNIRNIEEVPPGPMELEALDAAIEVMKAAVENAEYGAFAWDKQRGMFVQIGRPVPVEVDIPYSCRTCGYCVKIQGTDERICMLLKPTGKYCGVTVAYKIGETAYICPIIK